MPLRGAPLQEFNVTAKIYKPRKLMPACPGPVPQWLSDLERNGTKMAVEQIMVQAGRHFADSLNMAVGGGSGTRRQEATKLAWTLAAMLRPTVTGGRLEIDKPGDSDVERWAAEIFGVGACLELLRNLQVIDGRTIRKVGSRFDFEAYGVGALGKISIEAKGTIDLASLQQQRASFKSKLTGAGLLAPGGVRGYSRAIGVIFSAWSRGTRRRHDIEILDPEGDQKVYREEAIRELIRFYSRRFDETAGLPEAAERLWHLSEMPGLLDETVSFDELLGNGQTEKNWFNRASFQFVGRTGNRQEYWGSFWEGDAIPCPLTREVPLGGYRFAYTGIDRRVVDSLRARRFDDLLNLEAKPRRFAITGADGAQGIFLSGGDGILLGWMDSIPKEIRFEIE